MKMTLKVATMKPATKPPRAGAREHKTAPRKSRTKAEAKPKPKPKETTSTAPPEPGPVTNGSVLAWRAKEFEGGTVALHRPRKPAMFRALVESVTTFGSKGVRVMARILHIEGNKATNGAPLELIIREGDVHRLVLARAGRLRYNITLNGADGKRVSAYLILVPAERARIARLEGRCA